jgi:hypothetical protein
MFTRVIIVLAGTTAALLFISFGCQVATAETVDFQREVRPILASKCYACHGPDDQKREADLRLDVAEANHAIAPGSRDDSELWARITSDDADLRMPPSESHEPLSKDQVETLGRWIDAGATYETHWAFELPTRSSAPALAPIAEANGRIDHWIQAKLQANGLKPSPQADAYALVRRLYLDLTGLPPTPEQADRFVEDRSPVAYERLVDELLASPDYAERWARPWLDLARYADTNGYEKDRPRTIWPYRDWVLKAIAADMPFDEFSIRQLAGDMLPNASNDDLVATGFHRNTMLNEEGGIDPLEFRFHAMTDRVATTGLVWMGLTTGCAQCHTHKYDPITHRDYYAMMAIMNNADEVEQEIDAGQLAERRRAIEAEIHGQEERWIDSHFAEKSAAATSDVQSESASDSIPAAYKAWRDSVAQAAADWHVVRPLRMESTSPNLALQDDGSILASGDATKRDVYRFEFDLRREGLESLGHVTAIRLEALPDESLPAKGPGMTYYEGRRGDFFLSELTVQVNGTPVKLRDASHSYGKNGLGSGSTDAANVIDGEGSTGWSTAEAEGTANRWVANFDKPLATDQPIEITLVFERHYAAPLGRLRFSLARRDDNAVAVSLPAELESFVSGKKRSPDAEQAPSFERELQRLFFQTAEAAREAYAPIAALRNQMPASVRTLVMRERTQNGRETHRHHRGEYLQARETVEPGILEAFTQYTESLPTNRLEFAQWLVSDANPLVGRVTVDRAWREFFGRGIVHTAGDYGTQSEPPSHPELLDELALDLTQSGWSIKRLHREIVMSATYRQSSHRHSSEHAREAANVDPENHLLAIGPRRRLEAERLRDTMLAASGLVTRQFGGPSVYPPQPQSVTALAYGASHWPTSQGGDRYRRSVYTYAKRTAPFAAFTVFDGPTGELCLPRRDVSNSPLQSLTLMNDEMYVEIASMAVQDVVRINGKLSDEEMATALFRRFLTRKPEANEIEAILGFYRSMSPDAGSDEERWKWVARALMNLDEAITTP